MLHAFIPAKPDTVSCLFWGVYFERLLKRHFSQVLITGEFPHDLAARGPLILACTHGSWWDAAVTITLSLRTFRLPAIGMMEYRQLSKHRFLRRIGMFSVVREDARSALQSLSYAATVMQQEHRHLWMFPQGRLIHQDLPVEADPGIAIVSRSLKSPVIVPIALRYDVLHGQYPVCRIMVGTQHIIRPEPHAQLKQTTDAVSAALTQVASLLRADALAENNGVYREIIRGRSSIA